MSTAFFWLVEQQIAGASRQHLDANMIEQLACDDINQVICIGNQHTVEHALAAKFGVSVTSVALLEMITCNTNSLDVWTEVLPAVVQKMQQSDTCLLLGDEQVVAVSMAYYLMDIGAAPVNAVSQVRAANESAFQSPWDQFVYDVLYHLQ
ncbi:hypothetical protein [Shewanella maritima]|uniref:hypothetical protein n=1 Tax=Shewanella maritima TaxID=2520507 RepID=UPI0037355BA8